MVARQDALLGDNVASAGAARFNAEVAEKARRTQRQTVLRELLVPSAISALRLFFAASRPLAPVA